MDLSSRLKSVVEAKKPSTSPTVSLRSATPTEIRIELETTTIDLTTRATIGTQQQLATATKGNTRKTAEPTTATTLNADLDLNSTSPPLCLAPRQLNSEIPLPVHAYTSILNSFPSLEVKVQSSPKSFPLTMTDSSNCKETLISKLTSSPSEFQRKNSTFNPPSTASAPSSVNAEEMSRKFMSKKKEVPPPPSPLSLNNYQSKPKKKGKEWNRMDRERKSFSFMYS